MFGQIEGSLDVDSGIVGCMIGIFCLNEGAFVFCILYHVYVRKKLERDSLKERIENLHCFFIHLCFFFF